MTHLRLAAREIFTTARMSSLALLILATHGAHELSAQRAPNIDPAISRPPVLLTGTAAEANRQVRELALMTLMQALQSGDADLVETVAGDLATEDAPKGACRTLRDGMKAVKTAHAVGLQEDGGRLPIYPDVVTQRDSAGVTVVELDLLVVPKAKARVKTRARLTYDNEGGKWTSSLGLLAGLSGSGPPGA
jgi:hypothetical protein